LDEAVDIAVETVREYVEKLAPEAFDKIMWVLFDDRTLEAYERRLKED
jgi:O-acetyl-ADP-ribose deacetylase (regulator of RNase III)